MGRGFRMFTMTRAMEEALFQHFMHQKLGIAYAIHKPFPFFEGLLDNSIITKRMYMESLEACRNLIPVSRVVHNILTQLERTFNLSLLVTLFSQINLREYPNLVTIYRSFKRVGASYEWQSRDTPILLEAPTGLAEGSSLHTPLALPPPQPPQPSCSPCAPRVSEPGTSSQQSDEILSESPSPSDPVLPLPALIQEGRSTSVTNDKLTSKMNAEEDSEEMPSLLTSTVQVASDNLIPQIRDKEDPQEMPHSPLGSMPEIRDNSPEPNDPEEPQEVSSTPSDKKGKKRKRCIWSTPKRRHKKKSLPGEIIDGTSEMNEGKRSQKTPSTPRRVTQGAASPGHGIQEKLQVVDKVTQRKDDSTWNSEVMMRVQKARTKCARKSRLKEKKKEKDICSSSKRRFQKNIHRRGKPKSDTVDFHCSKLPVTCGEAKGILYKKKMKHGSSVKCIRNEDGTWLTPNEFEVEGKGRNAKNWKRNIRCEGMTLGELLKSGLLLCPPRINLKRELNSK
ncbi:sp110 nuclear body protein isoform X8 [Homo sapiens]|uniref:sp110 nuclear body protein isoform X8 n=2 Tax=Homo sapiens TaxID=9606 RepID=UPI0007DC559C|nr:sp110 nuclear body protein isoform X8 [Homo sapiens]|eukprot:XP_016859458.1 sp110 nuclear body protein isoform X10 [Homo sapiens]